MKFYNTVLDNGLTIIGEQNLNAASCAIGVFVKTGARDESPEVAGVSHFLEHMMFKGTDKRSALDVTYQLGAIGAQANAFTSEENTVYYMAILPEYFADGVELLSDMLFPALDQSEYDTEKKVILEEIALYKDRPTYSVFEAALREHFREHPAGNSVLGSIDSISALSRDQMKGYYDSRYSAKNMVFAAAGNFDWAQLNELVKKHCLKWHTHSTSRKVGPNKPTAAEKVLKKDGLHSAHTCIFWPGPSAGDDERYASRVLSCILGDGSGSRTYWDIIDKGLADSASVDTDEMDGTGVLYSYISCEPKQLDKVIDILRNILSSAMDFTSDDLERAKTKIATRLVLNGESSMRRLMATGLNWIYRKEYSELADEVKRIQAISREDIAKMLERFPVNPMTVVKLLPA